MAVEFKQATLANGLNVVAEVDPSAHTAAIGFFVKTGARDEDPAVMGVSHFLEHMMFKGTDTRSAEQVDKDFDDIGADHNAYTSGEMTAFWAHALPEHLPRTEEILSDILRPALREKDFDDEKSVILEEIAMYEDQPFWVLFERVMEAYFRTHPMAHRVLGTRDTIESMQCRQMQTYFAQRYAPDNTVVAMAGGLDSDFGKQIIIFRQNNDGATKRLSVDLNRLVYAADPALNVTIAPNDIIYVPAVEKIRIFVSGAVRNPDLYEIPRDEPVTLLKAITLAGGTTDRAAEKKVQIMRTEEDGSRVTLVVNLKQIKRGKAEDPILHPDDIVLIPESFF